MEKKGDFRRAFRYLLFFPLLLHVHVTLSFIKQNYCSTILQVWNKILNIKPCIGQISEHRSSWCECGRKIIYLQNLKLKLCRKEISLRPGWKSCPLSLVWSLWWALSWKIVVSLSLKITLKMILNRGIWEVLIRMLQKYCQINLMDESSYL